MSQDLWWMFAAIIIGTTGGAFIGYCTANDDSAFCRSVIDALTFGWPWRRKK